MSKELMNDYLAPVRANQRYARNIFRMGWAKFVWGFFKVMSVLWFIVALFCLFRAYGNYIGHPITINIHHSFLNDKIVAIDFIKHGVMDGDFWSSIPVFKTFKVPIFGFLLNIFLRGRYRPTYETYARHWDGSKLTVNDLKNDRAHEMVTAKARRENAKDVMRAGSQAKADEKYKDEMRNSEYYVDR